MPLESAADFTSYLDATTGHGVSGTITVDGSSSAIKLIIDDAYLDISGDSVDVAGFEPRAIIKYSDAPTISQDDQIVIDAITTDQGSVLKAQTTYKVKTVEPDNTGLISLVLEEQ